MSLGSRFLARVAKLPKRLSRARRQRGLRIRMKDGVELATTLYMPVMEGPHPTLLIREPYGLRGFGTVAEVYAERGYNVVLQAWLDLGLKGEHAVDLVGKAWVRRRPPSASMPASIRSSSGARFVGGARVAE